MSRVSSRRFVAGAVLFFSVVLVSLHACKDQPTGPDGALSAAKGPAGVSKVTLSVNGSGSTANGTLVSSRGGIKCTIRVVNGQVSSAGTCSKALNAGTVVSIDATPVPGGTVTFTGCDHPDTDAPLSCHVTMTTNKYINAAFAPPANSYQMTVSGGSNGDGTVSSSPTGITCQISAGAAGSTGCDATFPSSSQVTLTATATAGSYLTAWSGGGCETNGTGVHATSGTCVVSMNQAQAIVVSFATDANEALIGQWASPIAWPNVAIHAHLLPTGKVMTYGRMNDTPTLWDPATGSFTTLTEPADLFCSGHSLLPDGRLLVTGGHSGTDHIGTRTTFLFDPLSNTWSRSQDMADGRWYPTNTTLATGEVLTVAGDDTAGVANTLPEVWQNGTWRPLTGALKQLPLYPMMFAAPDGRVFMAGPSSAYYLSTTGTGAWSYSSSDGLSRDYGSAVMYDAGKILLVGGGDPPLASAEVIDLNAGAARRNVGSMAVARRQMNATLLADGTVLATGGTNAGGFNTAPTDSRVLTAELWSPATEQWRPLARMTHNRVYHSTALLLPDGRLLSVGSGEPPASGLTNDYTAEIFSPPYLFAPDGSPAVRPTITSAPTLVSYGQTFAVQTPDAARIVKATFIRLSSVTHAFNQNQRLNYLPVSAGGSSSVMLTAPSNANLAPPGDYMLFLIDSSGVPSVATIVRIG